MQLSDSKSSNKPSGKKTWNRETAWVLLGFLIYLAYNGMSEPLSILAWPFVLFAMAAFGFKQPAVENFLTNRDSNGGGYK